MLHKDVLSLSVLITVDRLAFTWGWESFISLILTATCFSSFYNTGAKIKRLREQQPVFPLQFQPGPHSEDSKKQGPEKQRKLYAIPTALAVSRLSECPKLRPARNWGVLHIQTLALLPAVSWPHILVLHKVHIPQCILDEDCSLLFVTLQISQVLKHSHFGAKFKIHCLLWSEFQKQFCSYNNITKTETAEVAL